VERRADDINGALSRYVSRLSSALVLVSYMVGPASGAEDWKTTAGIHVDATLTDNVNLAPAGDQQTDFYTTITPRFGIQHDGPRLKLNASISPSIVLYAQQPPNNVLYGNLAAIANLEAINKFFYIDAGAFESQTFLSPFGATPSNLGVNTANRTELRTLTLSPYIKGVTGSGMSYVLRNNNVWTDTNSSLSGQTYFQEWVGHLDQTRGVYSFGADYDYQYTTYPDQNPLTTQLARIRLGYQVDPELGLQLRLGYQTNNYFLSQPDNVIYGVGFDWTPTPRAQVSGYWEQQYFGGSYLLSASYRRRMTAFNLSASRNASTYPQLVFTLPVGNTSALLDAALTARIPDPIERQAVVNQIIQQAGLPPTLTTPYNFNTNSVALIQQVNASVAFLGVHNSVIVSAFYSDSQNIAQPGTPLPAPLLNNSDYTSWGPSATYTHDLSGRSKLNLLAQWTETKSNIQPFIETTQAVVRLLITTALSAKTTGGLGARIYRTNSTGLSTVTEHAVFATLDHVF
jgi:uncharacterized protein (PEP-CTERM system associated)